MRLTRDTSKVVVVEKKDEVSVTHPPVFHSLCNDHDRFLCS